jgi:HEAT repeat protein
LQAVAFALVIVGFIAAIKIDTARSERDRQARNEANNEKAAEVPVDQVPVVTGDRELDRALANLGAKSDAVRKAAADRLAGMTPNHHRPAVVRKIAEQLESSEVFDRSPLLRALGVWVTTAEVPLLIQLLDSKHTATRNGALDALGKLRDERAVKPVVNCFKEFTTRWHAEQALKKLGALAEKEVLALLDQPEKDLRVAAIYVLADIGTEQSIPALEEASKEFSTKGVAEGAIAAIKKRMRK